MPIYQAIVMGIIQGATEFLPVSSSGHLILIPWLVAWQDPGLTFDVALHAGTLVAVLIYFAPTWISILRSAFTGAPLGEASFVGRSEEPFGSGEELEAATAAGAATSSSAARRFSSAGESDANRHDRKLLWFLVAATIPGAVAGALFEKHAETTFRHPPLIAAMMILVGLIMWWSEVAGSERKRLANVSLADALTVGTAQAFAIIPGVSRSGSTIAAGLFRGMTRDAAARYSFLLSTPIIAGAVLFKAHHMLKEPLAADMRMPFLAGFIASAIVGYAAIAAFIGYLRAHSLKVFVVYRVVFGIIVLALAYRGFFR